MKISKSNGHLAIKGANYEAEFLPERMLVVLRHTPEFYYGMCLLSAIDTMEGCDIAKKPPRISVKSDTRAGVHVEILCDSSLWRRKCHHYLFQNERVEYWTEVEGAGAVSRAYYFRGTLHDDEVASVPGFRRIFSPMDNFLEKQVFFANEYTMISAGWDDDVARTIRGFAMCGAPLCFVFHESDTSPCLAAGILAKPGEYLFHSFEINHLSEHTRKMSQEPIVGSQAFSLAYHGHLQVNGRWQTPRLLLQFAPERYKGLERYVRAVEDFGGARKRTAPYQSWTYEPVYCTWHDQVALGINEHRNTSVRMLDIESSKSTFAACTQANCERWLDILKRNDIHPGTFIIDALWQVNVGDPVADPAKFPDLRKLIDRCHAEGIRVILWTGAWTRDGVPDNECLTMSGKPRAGDPTHPDYARRVARFMRRLFSDAPGCYNADGIKVDGLTATPGGPALKTHSGLSGFELLRAFLDLWYAEAKKVKPDCVIGLFTTLPYLADLCDFFRTGDLYTIKGDPVSANNFRSRIARIVMPKVAIDTDGALRFNYVRPDKEVLAGQNEAGVPCIYEAEWLVQRRDYCLPVVRKMNTADYAAIRRAWAQYRRRRPQKAPHRS